MDKNFKIAWITGAAGFLGSNAVRLFGADGWQVVGIARSPQPSQQAGDSNCLGWCEEGISQKSLIHLIEKFGAPGVVFHAAGAGSVGQAAKDTLGSFCDTVSTTAVICEVLRQHAPEATLLLSSSAAIYGVRGPVALKESDAVNPTSSYGWHKHMAEELCLQSSGLYGLRSIAIRYFSLYGPGLQKQIIWDVSRRIQAGENHIELFGDGGETRDFLFIDDAVNLALLTLKNAPKGFTVVNGGSGASTSIIEMAQLLVQSWKANTVISFNGQVRTGDPRHFLACSAQAQNLGFRSETKLENGLKQVVDWIRSNKQN